VDFFFECWRWSGEPQILEPDKAVDLRWFGLRELPTPVVPHELMVLESLARGEIAPVVKLGF
jgi:8-oxo-dGTP diphosphatase